MFWYRVLPPSARNQCVARLYETGGACPHLIVLVFLGVLCCPVIARPSCSLCSSRAF